MSGASSVTVAAAGPPFTVAQWQELEHQALIFKYLKAGLPVPPYLLLPMRKNFHQPSTLPYCSYFGKKIDPEPGRCRRTDGKKWRCSKNAHPDSKYCERHMNRTRNRSRKPVESQTTSQSASATGSSSDSTSCTTFLNLPQPSVSNSETLRFGNNVSRWQMDSGPYGDRPKEYRFLHGGKPEADEQKFLPGSLVGARSVGMSSNVSDTWQHASRIPSNSSVEPRNGTLLQNSYSQVQMLQGFQPLPVDAMLKQRQQRYESGSIFGSSESVKLESQSLQRLCDDWPKCRDLDSNLMDQRSYRTSSTVQLSMGIPMGSSPHNDFPSFNDA